jgi:hypothetical protein
MLDTGDPQQIIKPSGIKIFSPPTYQRNYKTISTAPK